MYHLKHIFAILLILGLCFPATSQRVDFDKVVTPPEMGTRNLKEYLVQLAWMNSPENEALGMEQKLREFELTGEKKDWMNDVKFSVNLNETHFQKSDTIFLAGGTGSDGAQSFNLFPIFNFNASVSLGTFANRKSRIGVAEQRVKIAEANVNQKKLKVRMDVLKRYEEYQMQQEILKAATQAEQDTYQSLLLVTDLFKADKANMEDYLQASTSYHSSVERRIKANSELNIAKLSVEELIGIPLDEAIKMRK